MMVADVPLAGAVVSGKVRVSSSFAVITNNTGEVPMYHFYWFGMHAYWWIFWVILWMLFFSFMTPVRRSSYRDLQTPLQLLQRRYAAGEITSEEYEEHRVKLLRDARAV